jgi:DNA-binding GntR family transcriptional regulator
MYTSEEYLKTPPCEEMNRIATELQSRTGARTAADRAYEILKQRIQNNIMPPDSQYLEGALAASLDMSRTPVREACVRLAEEGLLELRPRKGVRVLPISAADMSEIYDVLSVLEAALARVLAMKPASQAEIDALFSVVDSMDAALEANDLDAWAIEDEGFHRMLVQFAGHARLGAIVRSYWGLANRARRLTLLARPTPTQSNRDHRDLVEAIRDGEADKAEALHREHRRKHGQLLVSILRDIGLK